MTTGYAKKDRLASGVAVLVFATFTMLIMSASMDHGGAKMAQMEITADSMSALGAIPHDPIYISGNSGFTNESGVVTGSGSASDPYVISGWDIDAHGGFYCIFVLNTTHYFRITECALYNSTPMGNEWSNLGIGINIINVTNGDIVENSISSNAFGIMVWDDGGLGGVSNNISVRNNTLSDCLVAGFYSNCHSPTLVVSGNYIDGNGYGYPSLGGGIVTFADHNQFHDNWISNSTRWGIYINGDSNRIWHNSFYHNNGATDTYDPSHVQAIDGGYYNEWNSSEGYGNYWSDWTSPDTNGDGIVDVSYVVDGNGLSKDYYPLTTAPQEPIPEFPLVPLAVSAIAVTVLLAARARTRRA